MEGKEICKLCLKTITDSSFVSMDDSKRDMLLCTIPHIILEINSILKICKGCSENLQRSYEFKTFCFDRRDVKDLENNETAIMVQKSDYKCRLCWESLEINALDEVESEQPSLELMMKECLPDLCVNLKDNSTLCANCSSSLRNIFNFIRRCLESIDKMKDIVLPKPEDKNQAYEAQFCFVKIENADTHSEKIDTAKDHINPISICKMEPDEKEDDEFDELTGRNDAQVKTELIEEEESKQEITDQEYDEMKLKRHKSLNGGVTYKCEFCSYVTIKEDLLRPHIQRHKNPSDVTMYKCDWCPYETRLKSILRKHVVKHKKPSEITMYECGICPYASKWKAGIKGHRMKHSKRHKCDKCDFEADKRSDLLRHLQSHPEDASLKIYSCEQCAYSTRYKTNLRNHMNTHKDSSEVRTFKCDQCSYVTKHRSALKNHAYVHMDTSELTLFKCDLCSYETFKRYYFSRHIDKHKVGKEETTDLI